MNPDDELCLCFHVTQRKVVNYIRVEKPKRPAQLSDCFGAGTGCGWCRPFLERLFEQAVLGGETTVDFPTPEEYAKNAREVCPCWRRYASARRQASARRRSAAKVQRRQRLNHCIDQLAKRQRIG